MKRGPGWKYSPPTGDEGRGIAPAVGNENWRRWSTIERPARVRKLFCFLREKKNRLLLENSYRTIFAVRPFISFSCLSRLCFETGKTPIEKYARFTYFIATSRIYRINHGNGAKLLGLIDLFFFQLRAGKGTCYSRLANDRTDVIFLSLCAGMSLPPSLFPRDRYSQHSSGLGKACRIVFLFDWSVSERIFSRFASIPGEFSWRIFDAIFCNFWYQKKCHKIFIVKSRAEFNLEIYIIYVEFYILSKAKYFFFFFGEKKRWK